MFDAFESLSEMRTDLGGVKENTIKMALSKIEPDPEQPRKVFDETEIAGLAESINSIGLIQPIVVRKKPSSDDMYLIIAGERRYRACKTIPLEEVDVIVRDDLDLKTIRYMQVIENLQREALPIEALAAFVCNRIEEGDKQTEVASTLGLSQARISEFAQWRNFPAGIRDAVQNGVIRSMRNAVELYRLWDEGFESEVGELLQKEAVTRGSIKSLADRVHKPTEVVDTAVENTKPTAPAQGTTTQPKNQEVETKEDEPLKSDNPEKTNKANEQDEKPVSTKTQHEKKVAPTKPALPFRVICEYAGVEGIIRYDLPAKSGHFWFEADGDCLEVEAEDLHLRSIVNG